MEDETKKIDFFTLTIDNLLNMIKGSTVMVTGDNKYSIYLKKVTVSTVYGKSYEIVITNKKWSAYDEE